jgi:hypothetical protein
MKKKLIILAIVLLVAAIGIAIFVANRNKVSVMDYNLSATQRGWMGASLGKNDILILKSITHNPGGDSKAEFYVYRLQDGDSAANYMKLEVSQIGKDAPLEHIGSATCTFIGNDPAAVYDLKILYTR